MARTHHIIARHIFQYGLVSLGVFTIVEFMKPGIIIQTIDLYWYLVVILVAGIISVSEYTHR